MTETLIGVFLGGVITWLVAARYYEKQEQSLPPSLIIDLNRNLNDILDADESLRKQVKTISDLALVKQNAELNYMITELKKYVSVMNHEISKLPKHHEIIYKFFSTSRAAANGLTLTLIRQSKINEGKFTRKYLLKQTIEWCRAFFEMLISNNIPKNKDSHFKLNLWQADPQDKNLNPIIFSQPEGEVSFEENQPIIKEHNGNCLQKSYAKSEVIICSKKEEINSIFQNQNIIKITTVACFPIKDPVSNETIYILTVATNIDGFFSDHQEEINFIDQLISPFKMQLALAHTFN